MERIVTKGSSTKFFLREKMELLPIPCDDAACQLVAAFATELTRCPLPELSWVTLRDLGRLDAADLLLQAFLLRLIL